MKVYCFATNQMQDETTKDNHQTTAWISHDLARNNKLPFPSMKTFPSVNMNIYNLNLHNRHALQTVQHVNVLKNVTKNLTPHFQNLCFMRRNMQTELSKLDMVTLYTLIGSIKKRDSLSRHT